MSPGSGNGPACAGAIHPPLPHEEAVRAPTRARSDDGDVDVAATQVVGAAEPGDPTSDDDRLHDGMPAVASTSMSIPGTVNPVTIVVRTGRGAGKYSAQTAFHSSKCAGSRR